MDHDGDGKTIAMKFWSKLKVFRIFFIISEQEIATQASEQDHNFEAIVTNIREKIATQASEQNLDLDVLLPLIKAEVQLALARKINPIQALRPSPPETDPPEHVMLTRIRAEVQLALARKRKPIKAHGSRPPETDPPEEMDMSQNDTCKLNCF